MFELVIRLLILHDTSVSFVLFKNTIIIIKRLDKDTRDIAYRCLPSNHLFIRYYLIKFALYVFISR